MDVTGSEASERRLSVKFNANIAVFGKTGSGKSALITKLLTQRYIGEYSPKIDDLYKFDICENENFVTIREIIESSLPNIKSIVKWANIAIILYSISDRSSFYKALMLLEDISELSSKTDDLTLCLVANKADLSRNRVVLTSEISKVSADFNIHFYEISVAMATHSEIIDLFRSILQTHTSCTIDVYNPLPLRPKHKSASSFSDASAGGCVGVGVGGDTSPHGEKRSSPFSRQGPFSQSTKKLSSKPFHSSIASVCDSSMMSRRASMETKEVATTAPVNSGSKTSLNSIINSSAKKLNDGLKMFKKTPKH